MRTQGGKDNDGLRLIYRVLFKNALFCLRIPERWLILESQQELSQPADEDRVFVPFRPPQAFTNEPNKPSGHFVVVGAEFRGPCVCVANAVRGNIDIISRKRGMVSTIQLYEHRGTDVHGQDFLVDQCIVSCEIHALTSTLCLQKSRTNQREGQNELFPCDKCTPMISRNPEFPSSKSMLISISLYPDIFSQSTAFSSTESRSLSLLDPLYAPGAILV